MKVYDRIEDMLCDELNHIAEQKDLTPNALDTLNVAVDVIKDIHTIRAMEQEYPTDGYSQGYYGRMPIYMYDDGMMHEGNSYARGNYAQRDSRGRYMPNGYSRDAKDELQRMMNTAKDEKEREAIRTALDNMNR